MHCEILIIGAGAVGVSSALWLRNRGHDVRLLDAEGVATGATFGNASTLSEYACTPVAQPGIWGSMPRLLFSSESPFVIRWPSLPRLLPCLLRFMGQCTTTRYRENAEALSTLLSRTYEGYEPLLEAAPAARALMTNNGCLYSYASAKNLQQAAADIQMRERLGVHQQVLDRAGIEALEPAMAGKTAGGVWFPDSCHLTDPAEFIKQLATPLYIEQRIEQARVTRLELQSSGVLVTGSDRRQWRAERLILAAGAWSAELARQLGDRFPLEAERGYHIEFDLDRQPLSRPTCPVENAFYMTPMADGRLRAAGTVELSSRQRPLNPARLRYIEKHVRRVLEIDAPVARSWLGFRPTLPDYLPVIGRSPRTDRVIYAFGHQHLGLTLAGITGELVADCIDGRDAQSLAAFSPRRFT